MSTVLNTIVKTLLFRPKRYPTDLIYTEFGVLNLYQLHALSILKYTKFSVIPTVLDVHSLNTRQRVKKLKYIDRPFNATFMHSPSFLAVKLYNYLPAELKNYVKNKNRLRYLKNWIASKSTFELYEILHL